MNTDANCYAEDLLRTQSIISWWLEQNSKNPFMRKVLHINECLYIIL